MFETLDISSSGLQAQRARMDAAAQNIANISTTRGARGGGPYRRKFAVLMAGQPADPSKPGVRARIQEDSSVRVAFEKGHPDADAQGYVRYPNIELAIEMVNAMEASRAYEANVTTMEVTKAMLNASLRLLA